MKIEELSEELSHVNVQREELEARIKQLVEENEGLNAQLQESQEQKSAQAQLQEEQEQKSDAGQELVEQPANLEQ